MDGLTVYYSSMFPVIPSIQNVKRRFNRLNEGSKQHLENRTTWKGAAGGHTSLTVRPAPPLGSFPALHMALHWLAHLAVTLRTGLPISPALPTARLDPLLAQRLRMGDFRGLTPYGSPNTQGPHPQKVVHRWASFLQKRTGEILPDGTIRPLPSCSVLKTKEGTAQ